MAESSSTAAQAVTFGVELEMLVAYLHENDQDPASNTEKRTLVRIPDAASKPQEAFLTPVDRVRKILRDFLRSNGVQVIDDGDEEAVPPAMWSVGRDSSVREDKLEYRWAGVELRSPALLAETDSFDHVKRVVNLLRNNFRLRVNKTTGFHVHVGMGAHPFPPRAVRRLTQFLWCADGMLSQLHPPERMLSQFCKSIRHRSYLGQSKPDAWREMEEEFHELRQFVGRSKPLRPTEDKENPAVMNNRLAALQEEAGVFPGLNSLSDSLRLQRLPPSRTDPYEDETAQKRHGMVLIGRPEGSGPTLDGIRVLCQPEMYQNTTRAVHELTGADFQRLNYNLRAYDFLDAGNAQMRMTIEFREAIGSLNPSWVAAWARICSRIVEFCLQAEENMFVDQLMLVLEAELAFEANATEPGYDVIDLLNDLRLLAEAKFVEQNILIGNKNTFWFPCTLRENASGDAYDASILVEPEDEN